MSPSKILKAAGAFVAVVAVYGYVVAPMFGQAGWQFWMVLTVGALVIALPAYLFHSAKEATSKRSGEQEAGNRRSSAPFWDETRACNRCGTETALEDSVTCPECSTSLLRPGEMKLCRACKQMARGDWPTCEWCGEELEGKVYRGG